MSPLVLLAGFLFGVSINSHILRAAIGVLLAIESAFALSRRRGVWWIVSAGHLGGALICRRSGCCFSLACRLRLPQQLLAVTLAHSCWPAICVGAVRAFSFYATNYEIYVPIFTTLLLIVLSRRGLLQDSIEARIGWFSGAYLVAYVGLFGNVLHYFFYFGHLTIIVYLSVPVILGRLVERAGLSVTALFVGGLVAVAAVIALDVARVQRWSTAVSGSGTMVMAVCGTMLLCVGMAALRRRVVLRAAAIAIAVVMQVPFLSASHLTLYDSVANRNEFPLFQAIRQFQSLMNRYERPGERLMLWYPTGSSALLSLAS